LSEPHHFQKHAGYQESEGSHPHTLESTKVKLAITNTKSEQKTVNNTTNSYFS
jgi:hypothetical protein